MYWSLSVVLLAASALAQKVSVDKPEPFGIETTISPVLLNAFNPLVLNVMKQVVENIELPLPDQTYKIPKLGSLNVHFDKVRCHGMVLNNSPDFEQGMYFMEDYVGFRLAFDVQCRSNFSTNVKYAPGFNPKLPLAEFLRFAPHGWANLTLQGSKADSLLNFKYVPESRQLVPVLDKLDLKFESVDVCIRMAVTVTLFLRNSQIQMDDNPLANFVTKTFKKLLPHVTSMVFKRAIRLMIPGIVQSVMDVHFAIPDGQGNAQIFHTEFLAAPIIDKDGLKVKLTIAGGEGEAFGAVEGPPDFPTIEASRPKGKVELKSHLLQDLDVTDEEDPVMDPDDHFLGEKFWENAPQKGPNAEIREPGPLESYEEEDSWWHPKNETTPSKAVSKEQLAPSDEETGIDAFVDPLPKDEQDGQGGPAVPILPPQQEKTPSAKTIKELTEEEAPETDDLLSLMDTKWQGPKAPTIGKSNSWM